MAIFGAIIQARQNSSRLPGKMLKKMLGEPLIRRVVEQVAYSKHLDKIIVATSDLDSDNELSDWCLNHEIDHYRGDLKNVLKRFIDAAESFEIDIILRITGDNPLTDPEMIDQLIELYKQNPGLDYINNIHRDGAVHGAGCELVTLSALKQSYDRILSEPDPGQYLEHVTLFIRKNTGIFNTRKFYPDMSLSRKEISYSIDYPNDFILVEKIYESLYAANKPFKTKEVLKFLDDHPHLLELNKSLHGPLPDY
jgi:spore coat polysaccharide biosynthesis protein SpsF (cytidylyltransferase family)